jgi:hypothetical protein
MTLQAIETRYKGYLMRSRLEAKYGVFFDTLNIDWEYEINGFNLHEAGYYLPDFWLPKLECWIEIKGQAPTEAEKLKAAALARFGKNDVYLYVGMPGGATGAFWYTGVFAHRINTAQLENEVWGGNGWTLAKCGQCGTTGFVYAYKFTDLKCGCNAWESTTQLLRKAYFAARSARFEYGEAPNIQGKKRRG